MLRRLSGSTALSSVFLVLPMITNATPPGTNATAANVCGPVPDSWNVLLNIVDYLLPLLVLGVILSGVCNLYDIFFTEGENKSRYLFWWLLCTTVILAVLSNICIKW